MFTSAMLASLVLAAPPSVVGVVGSPQATQSALKRWTPDGARTLVTFTHASGWLPRATVDGHRVFAAIVAPGAKHRAAADLFEYDLATKERRLLQRSVAPRQQVLLLDGAPVFTTVGRTRVVRAGDRVLLERAADLLWPLVVRQGRVLTLEIGGGRARLWSLFPGAQVELRDFGARIPRDFSVARGGLFYQLRVPGGTVVERFDLKSKTPKIVYRSELPWLAPLALDGGVLVSLSPSAAHGKLGWISEEGVASLPALAIGAPIPEVKKGDFAVVRVQSKTAQRFFVTHRGRSLYEIELQGELLESAAIEVAQ